MTARRADAAGDVSRSGYVDGAEHGGDLDILLGQAGGGETYPGRRRCRGVWY